MVLHADPDWSIEQMPQCMYSIMGVLGGTTITDSQHILYNAVPQPMRVEFHNLVMIQHGVMF